MNQTDDPRQRQLFQRFPSLVGRLPWMRLADLPSPVQPLKNLGAKVGHDDIWMKRDDLNSPVYGGNKARKFEFIFAAARAGGHEEVLTFGSAGSNHGAATSLYCRHLGFRPVLALSPQPVLSYVRQNILVDCNCGAKFLLGGNDVASVARAIAYTWRGRRGGAAGPYFMYFGGSSRTGNVGFVEAGLEIAAQVAAGAIPKPRHIFVATGSCGSHAGLLVGLRLAGLDTQVVGVRIVPKVVTNRPVVALHATLTAKFLHDLDASFPRYRFSPSEINLLEDFYGGQYGRPTESGKEAIRLLRETEDLPLDPTYTGKAFAGMIDFIRRGRATGPVLFWQTLNSVPLAPHAPAGNVDRLPAGLQEYFQKPLYDPEL